MSKLTELQEQLSKDLGKLAKAVKAIATKAGKQLSVYIALLIMARKQYPQDDVDHIDIALTLNHIEGVTTKTVGRDTYFDVCEGVRRTCDKQGTGKPRDHYSRLISNYASQIVGACYKKDISEVDGWVTKDGDEVVPQLGDLKQLRSDRIKEARQDNVTPAKVVGQKDPKLREVVDASDLDVSGLVLQLERLQSAVAQSNSETLLKQFTNSAQKLANEANSALAELQKQAS